MGSLSPSGATPDPRRGMINLPGLVLARICTTAIFMTYPACLSGLLESWQMSAARAGLIQGGFTAAFALSLLLSSLLCDRIGAKRIFGLASAASAAAALFFALFARSFETGLLALFLVGMTQGGTYTPAIMLVSANSDPARKSAAIGWVLAGMSIGYVISIFLSTTLQTRFGYQAAFLVTAAITLFGWGLAVFSVKNAQEGQIAQVTAGGEFSAGMRRRARLLTLGYIGHSWELLGMWAWVPAFLAAAALAQGSISALELGLWTALALHLSGFFSSFLSGYAADRFGARPVLIAFALLGCLCSAVIGWLPGLSLPILLALVAVYGFATIGDSAVLSSAMTDAVPAQHLGKVLGLRSVLGIGAGALAPVLFGLSLDSFPGASGWGIAFSTLALGGLLATVCAFSLGPQVPQDRS